MKILIFDILITGHHSEYISHFAEFLQTCDGQNKYIFVVNHQFSNRFPLISQKITDSVNLKLIEIEKEEFMISQKGGLLKMSFSWYKLMNQYAIQFDVDHVILLYLNTFQLALFFFRPSYTISGILFQQFRRMQVKNWKDKVKYVRKYLFTQCIVRNNSIKRIHVLNDQGSVDYFNSEFDTSIFEMLPDPVPEISPLPKFDIYSHYRLNRNKIIILHIGSLEDRKGTFEVANSVSLIEESNRERVTVLIVGETKEDKLKILLKNQTAKYPEMLIWDNQFVSNEMMKSLFEQCDIVLMPYKNSEASSGILGHALASGKAVITTGQGLLKEIVLDTKCGFLIDIVTPANISKAISYLININKLYFNGEAYLESHSPYIFVNKMINFKFNNK